MTRRKFAGSPSVTRWAAAVNTASQGARQLGRDPGEQRRANEHIDWFDATGDWGLQLEAIGVYRGACTLERDGFADVEGELCGPGPGHSIDERLPGSSPSGQAGSAVGHVADRREIFESTAS